MTNPAGLNDRFLYNGLGQRTARTDSTGQYALVSDGARQGRRAGGPRPYILYP